MGTDQVTAAGAFRTEGNAWKEAEANPRGWGLGRRSPAWGPEGRGLGAGRGLALTEKLKGLFSFQEQREEEELAGRI